jgi:phosphoserine aminotransferase
MSRLHNFSAGPTALPLPALERAQRELVDCGHGASILETSHRSKTWMELQDLATSRLRRLLKVPDTHAITWLQGGASHQFAMLPLNFLSPDRSAAYVVTGTWSQKGLEEAKRVGAAVEAASAAEGGFRDIPPPETWTIPEDAAYIHLTSNNTIYGTQFAQLPERMSAPLVCDMSSDILSRPVDVSQFDLIYAGAQKNLGPAGVTVAIVRKSWLESAREDVPLILRYATHVDKDSTYNTPPVFAIYMVGCVLEWIDEQGGLGPIVQANEAKAARIYGLFDSHPEFFVGHALPRARSRMNITFNLPSSELEAEFIAAATEAGLTGLKGHRSIGGIRASTYNAISEESVEALAQFMEHFLATRG